MNTSVSCDILISGCSFWIFLTKGLIYKSKIEQVKDTTVSLTCFSSNMSVSCDIFTYCYIVCIHNTNFICKINHML